MANVQGELLDAVLGLSAGEWRVVDETLCDVDGTPNLARLGANAVLAVSLASVLAAADGERVPLYRYLSTGAFELPMPMVNIVSGGAHADGAIDIQDVLVVPVGARTFAEALEWSRRVRARTADIATERGMSGSLVADEGGLGVSLKTNAEALEWVCAGIERAGLRLDEDMRLAVDVAANGLYDGEDYVLATEGRRLGSDEWMTEMLEWRSRYPVASIEDPFAEDDWAPWVEMTNRIGDEVQILGDDLFVTSRDRLARGIDQGAANAILLKPNQAGTLARTEQALGLAMSSSYGTVVSARSGDTEDCWLADLAVAWGAGQIKVGSTTRAERTAKWNRLVQIEAELEGSAPFAVPRGRLGDRATMLPLPASRSR